MGKNAGRKQSEVDGDYKQAAHWRAPALSIARWAKPEAPHAVPTVETFGTETGRAIAIQVKAHHGGAG
jgi:hypothetical protein